MSDQLKIGLIGYGKMGKLVSDIASKYDTTIGTIFTSQNNKEGEGILKLQQEEIDVLVDFSHLQAVVPNVEAAAIVGLPIVIGTTGWYDEIDRVKRIAQKGDIGLFYASNFSIGVQILYKVVKYTARILDKFPDYDVYIHEYHHRHKKDSPSGTAITLAEIILDEVSHKNNIEIERPKNKINPDSLHVTSTRIGEVIGTHIVGADSEVDSFEIKHSAKNRLGFAVGALRIARWMRRKKGIHTMDEFLQDEFQV